MAAGLAGNFRRPSYGEDMLDELAEAPRIFTERHQDGDVYFAISGQWGPYAYVSINFNYPPIALLHLEMKRFSHNILKKGIDHDWALIKNKCLMRNCNRIYVTTPGTLAQNDKFLRFVSYFGFKDFTQHISSLQSIGEE
jgi:hypothetical protein